MLHFSSEKAVIAKSFALCVHVVVLETPEEEAEPADRIPPAHPAAPQLGVC